MIGAASIRVAIVDDHDLVRSGLKFFIQSVPEFNLVGEARNGLEAITLCAEAHPDVVLMDLVMPEMDGISAIGIIRKANPNIQVIALTSFTDQKMVTDALHAGAIGYLLKNVSIDELTMAICGATTGKPTIAAEAFKVLVNLNPPPAKDPTYDLTGREKEVLSFLAAGLTNNEIAANLTVSQATVKTHLNHIFSKLGVTNRVEAVTLALQHHLVEDQPASKISMG
jgi:NarL family two-component system response regulator LiaR